MIIPYLCPELPSEQQAALHSLVKTPLVYTSVALRNWQAFDRLKVHRIYAPGGYHVYFHLNPHVDHRPIPGRDHARRSGARAHGAYTVPGGFIRARPESRGPSGAAAHLVRDFRAQHSRSIAAHAQRRRIRRGARYHGHHGQSMAARLCTRNPRQPHVVGRAQFGRITIANSDAGGGAYTDSAINQGHRAVMELLKSDGA